MLALRRFRIFLLLAVFAATAVYYFGRNNHLGALNTDRLRKSGFHGATQNRPVDEFKLPPSPGDAYGAAAPGRLPTEVAPPEPSATATQLDSFDATSTDLLPTPIPTRWDDKVVLLDQEPLTKTEQVKTPEKSTKTEENGQKVVDDPANLQWRQQREHYPVKDSDLTALPSGQPKQLPKIQHEFEAETPTEKADRVQKLDVIRKSFEHAWNGYKKYALPHDELTPLSKTYVDRKQFMGWGATLVDTLDTLWIMGLHDEFESALKEIGKINFKTSTSTKIPMFETTIRYLGGLISAYDLSAAKHPILLQKAVELADVLMGAFDTPNRMPVPFYDWSPAEAAKAHRSHQNTVLAEIGSMTMEFTRLAQLTGKDKYYDAVARVTDSLEKFQSNTEMPGLLPLRLDSSGCKKVKASATQELEHQNSVEKPVKPVPERQLSDRLLEGEEPALPQVTEDTKLKHKFNVDDFQVEDDMVIKRSPANDLAGSDKTTAGTPECETQGLAHEADAPITFGIGGQADSVYEYLPKMFALLGGRNSQYQTMYEDAMTMVRSRLLYRPMIEDAKRNILFPATYVIDPKKKDPKERRKAIWDGSHLSCFAGGMFGLASRIFGNAADMDIARRLTDGCIWAYESTPTGIMPEEFELVPCESEQACVWSQKKWFEALDPEKEERAEAVTLWNKQQEAIYGTTGFSIDDLPPTPSKPEATLHKGGIIKDYDDPVNVLPAPGKPEATLRKGGIIKDYDDSTDDLLAATKPEATMRKGGVIKDYDETLNKRQASDRGVNRVAAKIGSFHNHEEEETISFVSKTPLSHEVYVQARITEERLPPGYTKIRDPIYKLRPEAIESVFIMYRLTGDDYWRQKGWMMFESIQAATQTEVGNAAIIDVTSQLGKKVDYMESFWLAETLKYFYLLFSETDEISLDDYVFNTEAHPFKLPKGTTAGRWESALDSVI